VRLLSYLAFLGVLEGLAFLTVILVENPRWPTYRAFAVLALGYVCQAMGSVFALGAEDPSLKAAGQLLAAWSQGAVGVSAAALTMLLLLGRGPARKTRQKALLGGVGFIGWALLSFFVPWVAGGLLLLLFFVLLRQPDTLSQWERHLQEAVPDAVVFLDKTHRILGANSVAHRKYPSLQAGLDFWGLFEDSTFLEGQWLLAQRRSDLASPVPLRWGETLVTVAISPHYDRFGDFLGAVVLMSDGKTGGPVLEAALSLRENEVVDLVVQGLTNRDIAERLFLSEGTVKRHLHHILAKTGVTRREGLRMLKAGAR